MRITGGLYCERADFTENGCFCPERADFCREPAIRFPGVYMSAKNGPIATKQKANTSTEF